MKKINVGEANINILSDAISKFIHSIDDERLEGAFIVSRGAGGGVSSLLLEIVHSGGMSEKIFNADKSYLKLVSVLTGVNITVGSIPTSWYSSSFEFELNYFPVRRMLKSGSIVYDVNGRLKELKEKCVSDDSVKMLKGAVVAEPPIQYRKAM